jgi:hypothetical protein
MTDWLDAPPSRRYRIHAHAGSLDVLLLLFFTGGACAAGLVALLKVMGRWKRAVSVVAVELISVPILV